MVYDLFQTRFRQFFVRRLNETYNQFTERDIMRLFQVHKQLVYVEGAIPHLFPMWRFYKVCIQNLFCDCCHT